MRRSILFGVAVTIVGLLAYIVQGAGIEKGDIPFKVHFFIQHAKALLF
nr:hypothetical protein [uncultured Rhodopila sp.]